MKTQTVTAVAFIHQNKKVLVAKRAATKKFMPNVWELPGGHVEFGESVEAALTREIREEFKIKIEVDQPFYVFDYLSADKTEQTVEIVFFAKIVKGDPEPNPVDHSQIAWIEKSEVEKFLGQNKSELNAAIEGFKLI